ncbi:MAG: type I methionyl aminopeptidase [Candidatus Dojkabacteria bacterium]
MVITSPKDEKTIREASEISVDILEELSKHIRVGNTPLQVDYEAGFLCKKYGVKAAFKRVEGYDFNTCISVNDVAVHGIPKDIPFKKGDLVSIDFGIIHKGMYTDHCWTWSIGEPDKKNEKLISAGRVAVENALQKAIVGNRTGDLGYEMKREATNNGFKTLSIFVGHGIGKTLHDEPEIPAFGEKGKGKLLVDGMVICVECQVVDDIDDVMIDDDGWSAKTINGKNSVMFEYMVIVRKDHPTILTDTTGWNTVV